MPLEDHAKELGLGDDFRNADPLWNAEVCFVLQQHLRERENPTSTLKGTPVNGMVHKTLDYVRKLNNYATREKLTASQELSILTKLLYVFILARIIFAGCFFLFFF